MRDPRFRPVTVTELPSLEYEISVLSPLRRVTDVQQIRIGEHGLLMKNGNDEGLLLPQVPVEQKWDLPTFLEQTCAKAGMRAGCWKDEDTDIFSFHSGCLRRAQIHERVKQVRAAAARAPDSPPRRAMRSSRIRRPG